MLILDRFYQKSCIYGPVKQSFGPRGELLQAYKSPIQRILSNAT
ncbi:hypothetical protein LEP1GSC192_3004 [Leptospira sp. B5-022]|nr:hypothetical protein LEP1GSC192_3004 [Leptospira sp. B5-022]